MSAVVAGVSLWLNIEAHTITGLYFTTNMMFKTKTLIRPKDLFKFFLIL